MELLWQALRQVVFILDQVTYGLIPAAYELIFYLANVNLFDNDILTGVINRVYLLLGIFMLFKIAFSLIQYMIDPNTFSDKSKGFGKLITNTLVAVVLLVMTPTIFEKAYELQGDIILSNAIPRVVLGDTSYTDFTTNSKKQEKKVKQQQADVHSMGVDVQFTLFSAFYYLNTKDDENGFTACKPTSDHPISNVLGSSDMVNGECWSAVQEPLTTELHKQGGTLRGLFKYTDSQTSDGTKCTNNVCDERDFATFGKLLWWIKAGGNSPFTIEYFPVISAIVGGYLLLLLVTFAIDIAVRVFKLLFLQAVAPIAIISYMDPKESVSSGKFHNWLVECGKTYGSLFLRLAVIYFAILLVRIMTTQVFGATGDIYYNGVKPTDTMNMFVYVFLVLGIFTFAKKVPQMIESIFGIKGSGELNLNPFKSGTALGALAGGVVGGTLGSLGGAGANFLAETRANRDSIISGFKQDGLSGAVRTMQNNAAKLLFEGKGFAAAKSTLAGNVSGAFVGGKAGFNGGKGVPNLASARQGKNAAIRGRQLHEQKYGIASRVEQAYNRAIGYRGKTTAETGIGNELKQAKQEQQNWNAQEEQIRNTIATHAANYQNGKFASQIQMITQTKQETNRDGELEESRVYDDYNKFKSQVQSQLDMDLINKQTVANMYGVDINHHELTDEEIAKAMLEPNFDRERQKVIDASILDQRDFENVGSMVDQQINASTEANKLESKIGKLETGKKNFNEKPKS